MITLTTTPSSSKYYISVIIPTYKPGRYIEYCIKSLGIQTLNPSHFEIIIVLNGCDEPWRMQIDSLIERYLSKHNCRLIQTDVPGVSNARNIGLDNAQGEYIAFVDDDDYVSPNYFEELLNVSAPYSIAFSNTRAFYDGTNNPIDGYGVQQTFEKVSINQSQDLLKTRTLFNGPCMKLIHSRLISNVRFDTALANGEDNLFMFAITPNLNQLTYSSWNSIYYRRYRNNSALTAKKKKSYWFKNAVITHVKYFKYWLERPFKYNFLFFVSKQVALWKGCVLRMKGVIK